MRYICQVLCALALLCLPFLIAGEAMADPAIEITGNYSHCTLPKDNSAPSTPLGNTISKVLAKVKFGAVGVSTLASDCTGKAETSGDGLGLTPYGDAASNLGGATISYSNDKIQQKATTTFKGAVGYTFVQTRHYGFTTAYCRIDNESQTTSGSKSKSQNQDEYGLVYRSRLIDVNFIPTTQEPPCNDNKCDLYFFVYVQPFILHDALRKSRSSDLNLRFVPLLPGVNQFNNPITNPPVEYFYYGAIFDLRVDMGHFSEVGFPLSLPTNQIGKTTANSEMYLPNVNYTRYGGRVGGFVEFRVPENWQNVFGSKPISASMFYADFSGKFHGVRHDLGETVAEVSVPVTSMASFAVTFDRGRSENVTAPVNSLMVGLKFGGQN